MQKSSIKESLAQNGFVFTDLDSSVRVTARGPKTPADPGSDGERDTVVRVVEDGVDLEHSRHSSRGAAAAKYVEHVEEYSDS